MRYFLLPLFLLLIITEQHNPQNVSIKSLKTYTSDNDMSFPVLVSGTRLIIEFDVEADYPPNLNIIFRFCDKNWNPTENIFLLNQGKNTAYFLDYQDLPVTVKEASYHFRNAFPDKDGYVSFPFSGKWKYFITDSQDPSIIYAEGKFINILNDNVELEIDVQNKEMDDRNYFPVDFGNVLWITTSFELPDGMFPSMVDEVQIMQNHKADYLFVIDRSMNNRMRTFEWDADRKFSFIARDVFPGNEYRQTDLRDINKFTGELVPAQFEGFETTRYFRSGVRDMNGGFRLIPFSDPFSTYMNVKFSIKPANQPTGEIYLVGAFNNWLVSEEYKLIKSADLYSTVVSLKRGIYDYQYVVAEESSGPIGKIDWIQLEGNSWGTSGEYTVILYYHDPDYGGYDRILGYKRFFNR